MAAKINELCRLEKEGIQNARPTLSQEKNKKIDKGSSMYLVRLDRY